ncbi:MAG: putative transporter ATP-binding protein YxlF [Planctomycetota bacterium]|jgi:ABC-2 type transport system ATP-binding protein
MATAGRDSTRVTTQQAADATPSNAERVKGERIVEAAGLTKTFSDFWMRATARAVDGIDFHIDRHEIFGLLGPNGSGKSTTIKMILGLLHKTHGRLVVFGRDPSDVAVKRKIGYLPEETYLYRFLNPTETLDYYGKLFGLDRRTRKRRTGELLEMVGLTQVAHRAAGEFSKGMARRLGLAQALVNDPELLILDEPTSGLDPIGTKQVKDLILELGRRGKTILLTSHLLADVEDVCDRMVILYGGKIRAAGTANELLADSRHTLIRAPRLDDATICAIDETLHRVQGVGIERVEAPRQTLENLFLDIVERARQEQLATSGAQSGGRIASFLQGDEANVGEAAESGGRQVVESLVQSTDAPGRATLAQPAAPAAPKGVDASMLDALVSGEKPAQTSVVPSKKPDAPQVRKAADVDQSLIDSLLSNEGTQDSKEKRTEGGA